MSRRGIARKSTGRHAYGGRDVGRALRTRSKIVRSLPDVISLQRLERLLSPRRQRGQREPTHA